jgi:hypothetical protein
MMSWTANWRRHSESVKWPVNIILSPRKDPEDAVVSVDTFTEASLSAQSYTYVFRLYPACHKV